MTRKLVDDLQRLQRDEGLRPDLIFFTGDLAFGQLGPEEGRNLRDQFDVAFKFLEAVRTAFEPSLLKTNVFLVPGNHDVDRTQVSTMVKTWQAGLKELSDVVEMVQQAGIDWQQVTVRLKPYRDALNRHGYQHLLPADHAQHLIYTAIRDFDGLRVGIGGFNSAWSCHRNGEKGQLWMAGDWQQQKLAPELRSADVRIALAHHPPNWLVEAEENDFSRGLRQDFRFLLHGHEHKKWVEPLEGGNYVVFSAAACYQGSKIENGYSLVCLKPMAGQGEVWLRRFDADGGGWVRRPVAKHAEDGVWPLQLNWLKELETSSSQEVEAQPVTSAPKTPPAQAPPTLPRYLERLRAEHAYLRLAGFVTKLRVGLELEKVYVPLRANVRHSMFEAEHGEVRSRRDLRKLAQEQQDERRDLPFDQALQLAQRYQLPGVVVLGDPGSGKTTLLKHFVQLATEPAGPVALGLPAETIPVLIELRRLPDPTAGFAAALEAALGFQLDGPESPERCRKLAQYLRDRGGLLVLLDGLDEVADPSERAAVSAWLDKALDQYPRSRFVVTSRYAGYQGDARLGGRFLELHVQDLKPQEARRFIRDWYRVVERLEGVGEAVATLGDVDTTDGEAELEAAADAKADRLCADIFEGDDPRTESLRKLATNPLMLQNLCLVHRDRRSLPGRRVDLYEECVMVLLETWRGAKGLRIDLSAKEAMTLLQPLAYYLHRAEEREAPGVELAEQLREPLRELGRDPEEGLSLLEEIRQQSGVLVAVGEGNYGFLHLSFQEYLCALYFQNRVGEPGGLDELAEHFGEKWWREVILLALGLSTPSLFRPLMDACLRAGVLAQDASLVDDCLRDAHVSTPLPFLEALQRGLDSSDECYHALRPLRGLRGWREARVGEESGVEIVGRLAENAEATAAVRRLAAELLGKEAHPAGGPVAEPARSGEEARAGQERVHEKDGSVLVFVPGGEYPMGADDITDDEKPFHAVRLSPYWIGKYPVTNAQFQEFLEAKPDQPKPEIWDDKQFNQPDQPVVGVSWNEAQAYCAWAGLELPSEARWEAAARGPEGRKYPWGEGEPTPEVANFADDDWNAHVGKTTPVDAYPQGAGPFGTLDQAGNVWEWCADAWDEKAYQKRVDTLSTDPLSTSRDPAVRVLRGGSWASQAWHLRAAYRNRYGADDRNRYFGFRVCVSSSEL